MLDIVLCYFEKKIKRFKKIFFFRLKVKRRYCEASTSELKRYKKKQTLFYFTTSIFHFITILLWTGNRLKHTHKTFLSKLPPKCCSIVNRWYWQLGEIAKQSQCKTSKIPRHFMYSGHFKLYIIVFSLSRYFLPVSLSFSLSRCNIKSSVEDVIAIISTKIACVRKLWR